MYYIGPTKNDIEERVDHWKKNSYAPTTIATRECQQRKYLNFCNDFGYDPLAPYPDQIVMYIAYLTFFLVYSSIAGYISGLSHFLKSNGLDGIDYKNFKIKEAMRGAKRTCPKGRGKAKALFPMDLLRISGCLNLLLLDDVVFWGAITLAFRALLRISNICGEIHGIKFKDISFVGETVYLTIRSSKTNQFAEYVSKIVIVSNHNSVLCPVYWLKELIKLSNPTPESFIFRRLIRKKWCVISRSWFSMKLKNSCLLAALGTGYSPHSLRRVGASYMSALNFKMTEIKNRGCWSSDAVLGYIVESDIQSKINDKKLAVSLP